MMKILPFTLITLAFIIAGCGDSTCYRQLTEVDSLIAKDKIDSACNLLERIEDTYDIKEGKEKAYYSLLHYHLQFRYNDKPTSDSLIDYSISYYTKNTDACKLALSYYLKGRINNPKTGIKYLKKAEFIAQETDDDFLKMRICNSISNVNMREENFTAALDYGFKSLNYGKTVSDKEVLGSCLITLSSIYGFLDKADSAIFYAEKCLPIIGHLTKKQQASVYINIAASAEETDTAKARKYALKAIETNPSYTAYQILAELSKQAKDYAQAESFLHEAQGYCKDLIGDAFITYEMSQIKRLAGKYDEANEWYEKAINLYDSINSLRMQDSITETQVAAELEHKSTTEIKAKDNSIVVITITLTVIIVIIAAAYAHRMSRHRKSVRSMEKMEKDMAEHRTTAARQMDGYKSEIMKMREDSREKERQMKEERKDMRLQMERTKTEAAKQKQQEDEYYKTGYAIYNKVKSGEGKVRWDKTAMKSLAAFYRKTFPDFRKSVESRYGKLTEYQCVLLILKDMGLPNKQIAATLQVSESAVRTMMSRINKGAAAEKP